jgi:hypothetical protein
MLFRTRVGLAIIEGPLEILARKHPKLNIWGVYASRPIGPRLTVMSFLGSSKGSVASYATRLACFSDSPDVRKSVGECMKLIEDALMTNAKSCDLSQVGDQQAWIGKWEHVQWSSETTG